MDDPREPLEDDDEEITLDDEEEGSDAGSLDNEGGSGSEAGHEPEEDQGQERVGGRAKNRIQTLRREAQEASERAARFERELNEERARYRQPQQPQGETPEQEQARLALMTTEERIDYRLRKAEERHRFEMNVTRFQAADMADKAAYESKAQIDTRYKKYQSEVERLLYQERQQGRDFPRETVLKFVLGQAVINSKNKSKQQARGEDNIRRQQARADSGRSDVPARRERSGQGNTLAELERRLTGVNI